MASNLSNRQEEILAKLYGKASAPSLGQRISTEQLPAAEIENVSLRINEEFLMHGLGPCYEPNDYGLELDALLELVNRPRLRQEADKARAGG
jgi:hypothetical protein